LKSLFSTEAIAWEYRAVAFSHRAALDPQEELHIQIEQTEKEIVKLESIRDRLDLYPDPPTRTEAARDATVLHDLTKVFVVHGHDEAALQVVARFLEQLELEAIVLREEPDAGRTIIEKFEDCATDVSFAVVLLTPDDLGGPATAPAQVARARQNVIFELGYFAGKLGRGRACLLRKGEVEIPSDLYGVIYKDMDAAEGWKLKLVRELNAAGLDFDPRKLLT
jgi:predicted nucleotide-binding protein